MSVRLAIIAFFAATSCRTGAQIRESAHSVRVEIDRAKRAGAVQCAPKELATAEANLDFVYGELEQASASRAWAHLLAADAAARQAVVLSRGCTSRQAATRGRAPVVLKIDEIDGDGDGINDTDDRCPAQPGRKENKGCPVEPSKDTDGDGIVDSIDKCPLEKEDFDGVEDADGCPDRDNDGDGVDDVADKCPNVPGPAKNFGCPVLDSDGDGIKDDVDECPNEPEDKDGFQDEDGCPDLDNDNDGIPDEFDQCPNQAGLKETQGCPVKSNDSPAVNKAP